MAKLRKYQKTRKKKYTILYDIGDIEYGVVAKKLRLVSIPLFRILDRVWYKPPGSESFSKGKITKTPDNGETKYTILSESRGERFDVEENEIMLLASPQFDSGDKVECKNGRTFHSGMIDSFSMYEEERKYTIQYYDGREVFNIGAIGNQANDKTRFSGSRESMVQLFR